MKKLLVIIGLCVLQCACASAPQTISDNDSLLSFADLAVEINVAYEALPEKTADPVDEDVALGTP